jgi:hypothetical protein
MKNVAILYALAAMSMSSKVQGGNDGSFGHGIPDEPKRVIPNGCKEYKFYGITVVATSEKKARKKAHKRYMKGGEHGA